MEQELGRTDAVRAGREERGALAEEALWRQEPRVGRGGS